MTREVFLEKLRDSEYLKYVRDRQCSRDLGEDFEIHHIYPRSFEEGKIDEDSNIVKLTKVEHLRAHLLLVMSLERIGSFGKSYGKAVKAVNFLFLLDWKKLTEKEKLELIDKVEDLISLSQRALHESRSDEVRQKIKNSWTPERRRALSLKMSFREVSSETRKRMGEANRRRAVAPMQGKSQTAETKKAISKALKKYKRTQEHCQHIREAKLGKPHAPHSDETKTKMSQTAKSRIIVWKNGKKAYCRQETLQEYLGAGYVYTKKESMS